MNTKINYFAFTGCEQDRSGKIFFREKGVSE
jgi:hypothetical protein